MLYSHRYKFYIVKCVKYSHEYDGLTLTSCLQLYYLAAVELVYKYSKSSVVKYTKST